MNSTTDERKGCGISFAEFQAQRLVSQILPSPVLPTGIKHDIEDGRREGLDYSDILLKIRVALRTSERGSDERSLFLWLEDELREREAVGAKLKQDENGTWITEHPAMTLAQWLDERSSKDQEEPDEISNSSEPGWLIKTEILSVAEDWPLGPGAPTMSNILEEIPQWVDGACKRIGAPGRGQAGSHRWNPAILADACCTETRWKKWRSNRLAMGKFLAKYFEEFVPEWERIAG